MEVVYKNCISMLNRRDYEFVEKDDDNENNEKDENSTDGNASNENP